MLRSQLIGKERSLLKGRPKSGKKRRPSPAVRNLARLLQQLPMDANGDGTNTAASVLERALQLTLPSSKTRSRVESTIRVMLANQQLRGKKTRSCTSRIKSEQDLAFAVYGAFYERQEVEKTQGSGQKHPKKRKRPSGYNIFVHEYAKQNESDFVKDVVVGCPTSRLASQAWNNLSAKKKSLYEHKAKLAKTSEGGTCSLMSLEEKPTEQSIALVSDSEGSGALAVQIKGTREGDAYDNDDQLAASAQWASFMECINLQVATRAVSTRKLSSSSSLGQQGPMRQKNKTWEVYCLTGPAMPTLDVGAVRRNVQKEFLTVFDGSIVGRTAKRTRQAHLLMKDCRVHAQWQAPSQSSLDQPQLQGMEKKRSHLWIQINIGRSAYAVDDVGGDAYSSMSLSSGFKKKSQKSNGGAEFLALVLPESNHVALTTTSGGVASRSRFTPFVVSALESAMTCITAAEDEYSAIDVFSRRVEGLVGTDPYDLLFSARSAQGQGVVGRFAHYSAQSMKSDPITELQTVATRPLRVKTWDEKYGDDGEKDVKVKRYGQSVSQLCDQVSAATKGESRIIAVTKEAGVGVIVDHSAGKKSRRKRSREAAFGRAQDCPRISRLRWEWKGETHAPAASWLDNNDNDSNGKGCELPKDSFKCRVTLQGSDVFAGLRALIDAGIMTSTATSPLPSYVRDAPGLGATIHVENGAIVSKKDGML